MPEDRKCPDCGSEDFRRFMSGDRHYIKCRKCQRIHSAAPAIPKSSIELLQEQMVMTPEGPKVIKDNQAPLAPAHLRVLEHERGYKK